MAKQQMDRIGIRITKAMSVEIDDLQHERRFRTRTAAILAILRAGIDTLKNEKAGDVPASQAS